MRSRTLAIVALLALGLGGVVAGGVVAACSSFGAADDEKADASAEAGTCEARLEFCADCVETFATTEGAGNLALSGAWLYWTTSRGTVMRQPTNGTNAELQTVADKQEAPRSIVADDRGVFWLNGATGVVVTCAPAPGGACVPKPVATGPITEQNESIGMALDATRVYWAVNGGSDGGAGGVFGAARGGGDMVTFTSDPAAKFVAVDERNVYWQTNCSGAARRPKDLSGLEVPLPKTCTFGAGGLVLDDQATYLGGLELLRVPRQGGSASLRIADADSPLTGLATACTDIYWSEEQEGGTALVRLPRDAFYEDGGVNAQARETLALNAGGGSLVADETGVYWSTGTTIRRLHPQR